MPSKDLFNTTISKTNEWIKHVEEEMHVEDKHKAYLALRAVLHALRDRLTVKDATDLGSQLPMLVRGFYFEGWVPTDKPLKIHTEEQFLENVRKEIPQDIDAKTSTRAVLNILQKQISAGEIRDIKNVLPDRILKLWPPEDETRKQSAVFEK